MAISESFDAPMMDFSGEDIPMQTSSSVSWIHPEATMDDDSNFNLGDVEIDMENYHPETFEYEMTDDSSAQQPIEVHDVEVIDVSQAHTPAIIDTVVEDATTGSPTVPEHDLIDTHGRSPLDTPPTLVIQVPSPTSQPALDEGHPEIALTELPDRASGNGATRNFQVLPPHHALPSITNRGTQPSLRAWKAPQNPPRLGMSVPWWNNMRISDNLRWLLGNNCNLSPRMRN
jgi:hypothetical protein